MKSKKALVLYLLLNIIVSALTTLCVLWLWDSTRHTNFFPFQLSGSSSGSESLGADAEGNEIPLPPTGQKVIEIKNVFGVGDLENEMVLLERAGEGELYLKGWKLKDQNGHVYTFPGLRLNKGGAVQVFSRTGTDTVITLYWGQTKPVWKTGETVTLLDYEGVERARYKIP